MRVTLFVARSGPAIAIVSLIATSLIAMTIATVIAAFVPLVDTISAIIRTALTIIRAVLTVVRSVLTVVGSGIPGIPIVATVVAVITRPVAIGFSITTIAAILAAISGLVAPAVAPFVSFAARLLPPTIVTIAAVIAALRTRLRRAAIRPRFGFGDSFLNSGRVHCRCR
ncbi:MAG: hypothetical protein AB7N71_06650 [Phycisphaerae bacterium]